MNLPAVEVRATRDTIITVDMEVPACHIAVQKWQPNYQDGRGMPFLFHHGRSNLGTSGGLMRMFSRTNEDEENHFPKAVALAPAGLNLGSIVAITPDGRHLFTGEKLARVCKVGCNLYRCPCCVHIPGSLPSTD